MGEATVLWYFKLFLLLCEKYRFGIYACKFYTNFKRPDWRLVLVNEFNVL